MLLSKEERKVVDLLGDAWNAFCELDSRHPQETDEFCGAIHVGQHIIMSRPVAKELKES